MGSLPSSSFKVSVIVPVFNSEAYLEKCLDSILSQTLDGVEVIVVDDGSTDASAEILAGYAAQQAALKVIRQSNSGLGAARNRGLEEASGEFISFVDSDDYVHPAMLQRMLEAVRREQSDVCICQFQQVDEQEDVLETSNFPRPVTSDQCFRLILSSIESSMACNKLIRRDLLLENGVRFPVGLLHEDVPTMYQIFHFTRSVSVVDEPLYFWVRREGTLSKSISPKHALDLMWGFALTRDFLRKHGLLETYRAEFFRRVVHFSVGLIGRYQSQHDDGLEAHLQKILESWMGILGVGTTEDRDNLQQLDPKLHGRYCVVFPIPKPEASANPLEVRQLTEDLRRTQARLYAIESASSYRILRKVTSGVGKAFPDGSRRRFWLRRLATRIGGSH